MKEAEENIQENVYISEGPLTRDMGVFKKQCPNLKLKLVEAKEIYTYNNEWIDANRVDYRQSTHTLCPSESRKKGLKIFDVLFYLKNRLCVAGECWIGGEKTGYNPNIRDGLCIKPKGLDVIIPGYVSDIAHKLISDEYKLILNINTTKKSKENEKKEIKKISPNKKIYEIDYDWFYHRAEEHLRATNPNHGELESINELSFCFSSEKSEIESFFYKFWPRDDAYLGIEHFCGYVVKGDNRQIEDLIHRWVTLSKNDTNRNEMRDFMEDNSLLALDHMEDGWSLRITTQKLTKSDLEKMLSNILD